MKYLREDHGVFRKDERCEGDGRYLEENILEEEKWGDHDHHTLVGGLPDPDKESLWVKVAPLLKGSVERRVLECDLFGHVFVENNWKYWEHSFFNIFIDLYITWK